MWSVQSWSGLLAARRDGSRLFWLFALESFLVVPERGARVVWALVERGGDGVVPFLRLASEGVIVALLFSGGFALLARVLGRRRELDWSDALGLAPFAFLPHAAMTAVLTMAWALDLSVPRSWAQLLVWAPVAASTLLFLRATGASAAPAPNLRGVVTGASALLLLTAGGLALRVYRNPEPFRPVGAGHRVGSLVLAPLTPKGAPRTTLTFPRARPVVADFWATWCTPCVESLPAWQKLSARADALGADFVSINTEPESTDDVLAFLAEKKLSFDVFHDAGGLEARLGIDALPTLVVIDGSGAVSAHLVGMISASRIEAEIQIAIRR